MPIGAARRPSVDRPHRPRAAGDRGARSTTRIGTPGYSKQQSDPPADGRLRARRLAGRTGGVDPREVLGVDRLRRAPRERARRATSCSTTSCCTGSPATAASSARLYWESFGEAAPIRSTCRPAAASSRRRSSVPSRRWAETRYTDIRSLERARPRRPLRRLRATGPVRERAARRVRGADRRRLREGTRHVQARPRRCRDPLRSPRRWSGT